MMSVVNQIEVSNGKCEDEGDFCKKLEMAEFNAGWSKKQEQSGYPIMHTQSVVSLWGALEVLAEDVAVSWLENTESAWTAKRLERLKVPIYKWRSLDTTSQTRLVVAELARESGAPYGSGVTHLNAVLENFDIAPPVGTELRRSLHELGQVRNVLVHCGGVADDKLISKCPWLALRAGDAVEVPHTIWAWYTQAATRYGERLFSRVLTALGLEGCECPGMDTVRPRPNVQAAEPD
jgi:hypothetical protein